VPIFRFFLDKIEGAIIPDFGSKFFESYGCQVSTANQYLRCENYQCYNVDYSCSSSNNPGPGFIIAVSNMAMLFLGVLYTWIGSWCCDCCCPDLKLSEHTSMVTSTNPTSPVYTNDTQQPTPINYLGGPYIATTVMPQVGGPRTFTLIVHHGGVLPTKMVLTASNFQELEIGVGQNLGVSSFKLAVYDDLSKQYVMVNDLSLIPSQATVQLLFQ